MPAAKPVKSAGRQYRVVGVITNAAEFRVATRMSDPPDLFELRLDQLFPIEKELERKIPALPAPIIITARHPAEGGANNLALRTRLDLLLRFLPKADYVDVELRSVKALRTVLDIAEKRDIRRIVSFHDFRSTPSLGSLRARARAAKLLNPAVFKVVARTDTPAQLRRLFDFALKSDPSLVLSSMGVGKFGAISRLLLARCGSALVYTSLSDPQVEGQMSLDYFRLASRVLGIA